MNDLTILLDAENGVPLYEQIYRAISKEIIEGRLKGGTRLPSRRALSAHLKVSEQTVNNAIELLKSEGFLRTEDRRGYFVESLLPISGAPVPRESPAPNTPKKPRFDFSPQSTDIKLFPYKVWTRLLKESVMDYPEMMNRGDPKGEPALRAALSQFLHQYRGVVCASENIIIASGVDQLMETIAALFEAPVQVAYEDPGYKEVERVFSRSGHEALPLPLDASGLDVKALAKSGASLVYITPSHQFPTGISMPAKRRAELLHWAAKEEGRYIIEDDYDSEYRYATRPLPALQSLDAKGKVIYLSTFSRSLAPGLRIAYMALPDALAKRYTALRLRAGETVSRYEQKAMAMLLEEEHYSRHLRKAGKVYEKRCAELCAQLQKIPGAFLQGQEAGLHFIFGIKGKSEEEMLKAAKDIDIPLIGLSRYAVKAKTEPALVLGFGGLDDQDVDKAVSALRSAWKV